MAYTMTARQFFEGPMAHLVTLPSPLRELGGVIEFAILGEKGGTWSVDLDKGEIVAKEADTPACIIRSRALDFMALVEGRMSVSDGLLTERLQITGDAARLTYLIEAIEGLSLS